MTESRLVSLSKVQPSVIVEARYASANNILGRPVYDSLDLFLIPDAACRIGDVARSLEALDLKLKVWDAYRPQAVQELLWDAVRDARFVTPPDIVSPHSRGCAVDVTLVTTRGEELQMPTDFDYFGEAAFSDYGALPSAALDNRTLLTETMLQAGFEQLPTEWWHFHLPDWQSRPEL